MIERGTAQLAGCAVDYEVRLEPRRDTRYSLTQRRAYLRLPLHTPAAAVAERTQAFKVWIEQVVARRPALAESHQARAFATGQTWTLGPHAFTLTLAPGPLRGASARETAPGQLLVRIPDGAEPGARDALVERLLWRHAARVARPGVEALVAELNAAHFRVGVTRVKLSPTRSRWGSCSTAGTVSLSTRLLAAPEACLRAVIVHELAHRLEMNHSPRFWALVHAAVPDYATADAWLRERGGQADWVQA